MPLRPAPILWGRGELCTSRMNKDFVLCKNGRLWVGGCGKVCEDDGWGCLPAMCVVGWGMCR